MRSPKPLQKKKKGNRKTEYSYEELFMIDQCLQSGKSFLEISKKYQEEYGSMERTDQAVRNKIMSRLDKLRAVVELYDYRTKKIEEISAKSITILVKMKILMNEIIGIENNVPEDDPSVKNENYESDPSVNNESLLEEISPAGQQVTEIVKLNLNNFLSSIGPRIVDNGTTIEFNVSSELFQHVNYALDLNKNVICLKLNSNLIYVNELIHLYEIPDLNEYSVQCEEHGTTHTIILIKDKDKENGAKIGSFLFNKFL